MDDYNQGNYPKKKVESFSNQCAAIDRNQNAIKKPHYHKLY